MDVIWQPLEAVLMGIPLAIIGEMMGKTPQTGVKHG
jgi:hypothetical protein